MTGFGIWRTLRIVPLCWLILPTGLVLAQGRASSMDGTNRALVVDNVPKSAVEPEVLPSGPSPLRQWTGAISAAIHARMNPQAIAGTRGGTAVVRFTVLRSGEVKDVSLARSSGVDQLDRAALAVVQNSLPVAPAGVTQSSLSVSIPLQYHAPIAAVAQQLPASPMAPDVAAAQSRAASAEEMCRAIPGSNYCKQIPAKKPVPAPEQRRGDGASASVTAQPSSETVRFVSCLRRMRDATLPMFAPSGMIAAVGQLLGKCNDVANEWEASCRSNGISADDCSARAAVAAAGVLKETGQLPAR